jgi:hypothetical protein
MFNILAVLPHSVLIAMLVFSGANSVAKDLISAKRAQINKSRQTRIDFSGGASMLTLCCALENEEEAPLPFACNFSFSRAPAV